MLNAVPADNAGYEHESVKLKDDFAKLQNNHVHLRSIKKIDNPLDTSVSPKYLLTLKGGVQNGSRD